MSPAPAIKKIEIAALGLINWHPMHGYLLNQLIRKLGIEQWANLSQSSIYYALGKLTDRGAVTVTTERDGKSPERTVFHISESGRQILADQLRLAISTLSSDDRLFYLAMSFIDALPVEETIELLRSRSKMLTEIIDESEAPEINHPLPHHFQLLCQAGTRHMKIEYDVCQDLITLLEGQPDYFEKLGRMTDEL